MCRGGGESWGRWVWSGKLWISSSKALFDSFFPSVHHTESCGWGGGWSLGVLWASWHGVGMDLRGRWSSSWSPPVFTPVGPHPRVLPPPSPPGVCAGKVLLFAFLGAGGPGVPPWGLGWLPEVPPGVPPRVPPGVPPGVPSGVRACRSLPGPGWATSFVCWQFPGGLQHQVVWHGGWGSSRRNCNPWRTHGELHRVQVALLLTFPLLDCLEDGVVVWSNCGEKGPSPESRALSCPVRCPLLVSPSLLLRLLIRWLCQCGYVLYWWHGLGSGHASGVGGTWMAAAWILLHRSGQGFVTWGGRPG